MNTLYQGARPLHPPLYPNIKALWNFSTSQVSLTGVKRIRIHGIRHSHISLLIDMGFSAVAIADRVGHESIDITYRYAHVFSSTQREVADKLDELLINSSQYIEKQ